MGCGSSFHTNPNSNQWAWVSGANTVNQSGTYGTQGTPANSNVPGARAGAVTWTDRAGNFWLFGGNGYDSAGTQGQLNDLWVFTLNNQWVWVSGANTVNQSGTYGTQGTAANSNVPGARSSAVTWTDRAGNFWLFGGTGYDSAGTQGQLNDLWVFTHNNQWIWVSGSNLVNQSGVYGTLGTGASGNVPGARSNAVTWTDRYGNLWLFGGIGYDSDGALGELNDLWVYSNNQWIWQSGSNVINQSGVYGTQGSASPDNVPGARASAVTWIDQSGNFWLFGGTGYDSAGTYGQLNDLWVENGSQWTWVSGSNLVNQSGTYGTQGTGATSNVPGARSSAIAWTDRAGNFWLFGGTGYDSAGNQGQLNDLWVLPLNNKWVWVSGSNTANQNGTYGTLGKAAPGNIPGARSNGANWIDGGGNLWQFGGIGNDSAGTQGELNDLWVYQP
jgi:hypothetical protein